MQKNKSNIVVVIGAQWGDEGKGKITDLLGMKADLVIRYQGGNNAGHTIIFGDQKIVLHQVPSGILHENCFSVVAHGVVFEPEAFLEELKEVTKHIPVNKDRMMISLNATVITTYHKLIDALREGQSAVKIGTTGKGIGPAYEDKVARRAIKVQDLFCKETLVRKLTHAMEEKSSLFFSFQKNICSTLLCATEKGWEKFVNSIHLATKSLVRKEKKMT